MYLLRANFYFFYMPAHKVIGINSINRAEDRDPWLVSFNEECLNVLTFVFFLG